METIGALKGRGAEYYQKLGYALQKNKKYAEAIDAYLKADTLKPDNIWNNRHLAICYRLNRNYQAALSYYKRWKKLHRKAPMLFSTSAVAWLNSVNTKKQPIIFQTGFHRKQLYKSMAWYRMVFIHQPEVRTSNEILRKIIGQKPLAIDYMNAGHVAWAMGDIQKAAALYGKSITANGNRERFLKCSGKTRKLFSNKVFKKRISR